MAGKLQISRRTAFVLLSFVAAVAAGSSRAAAGAAAGADEFFENEIRPLLVDHCVKCHGAEQQNGGLRLDSEAGMKAGGDSGPLIDRSASASLLLQVTEYDGDIRMPPDGKLTDRQLRSLKLWVESGARWPEQIPLLQSTARNAAFDHWAFQPVRHVEVPVAEVPASGDRSKLLNPIDAFVMAKRKERGLEASPEADQRTLIRRVSYSLTGLPPSQSDVDLFSEDRDPAAWNRLIDRLLDSPAYGEHWARHWLDVARYSDTKGYVYAREERFWVHAWAYRDWVASALNSDMPYNRFLLLQMAADQVEDCSRSDLAAMGFLTLGRRFLGVRRDIIDDRIDVVTRGTMSLTVGCARCHDHKYDPIPTADYYSLYGVFDSCREDIVALNSPSDSSDAFHTELAARIEKLNSVRQQRRQETAARVRSRVGDYLNAQTELQKYPEEGFDQILAKDDILPAFVRRWQTYLKQAANSKDPVFTAWHAYVGIPADEFSARAASVTFDLKNGSFGPVHPVVAAAFETPPTSFSDVIRRYASVFADVEEKWQARLAAAGRSSDPVPEAFQDPDYETLRRVLYGPNAPCEVPDEPIVEIENDLDSASCTELWKLQGDVDRWIIAAERQAEYAAVLRDREVPSQPRIFKRGDPANKGDEVPRQFLMLLSGRERQPFRQGSGRLELAQAIIDPQNPLTARVIVNRVWAHHFGAGLVTTPGDFGTRADPPSHPELLDWLAARFMADGWSLKNLHRLILTSAVWRQSSAGPADPTALRTALTVDPENRLLWRMNVRRLTFEEMRDSMLQASGQLERTIGGKPQKLFEQPFPVRRTLYGLVDRQFLPGTLRMFDFANPDLHIPERSETTVPQQALFLMNHPLALERARRLAALTEAAPDTTSRIEQLYQAVYQRPPDDQELRGSLQLVQQSETVDSPPVRPTAADWSYGYGRYDEPSQRVVDFASLPHFTGSAWQGGAQWPDAKLGWVQLTAAGGHQATIAAHASVRRWTAPRDMTIRISSQLIHTAAPGDGIRAFIVSSSDGLLSTATVHQQTAPLNVATRDVRAGDTLDFVVDIGDVLNSDQHEWRMEIQAANSEQAASREQAVGVWNSEADFTKSLVPPLTPWEQLAQVLLCSNEFLFID